MGAAREPPYNLTYCEDPTMGGTVARLCGNFVHVVGYTRQTLALRGTARSAASYGSRLLLPLVATPPPTAPACCFSRRPRWRVRPGPFDPGPPDPKFKFGLWLVTAPGPGGPGPGGQRTFA